MEMKFVFGIWFEEYVMSIEEDGLTKSDLEYGDEIEVMEDWMVWLRNCGIGDAMEFMKMMERMHEDAFMKVVEMMYEMLSEKIDLMNEWMIGKSDLEYGDEIRMNLCNTCFPKGGGDK